MVTTPMDPSVPGQQGRRERHWSYVTPLLVAAAAAALRLWGIRWGLPDETHLFSYHPDEFHSLRGALSLAAGDPNPHFLNYGSLYLYLVAIACLWHESVSGSGDLLAAILRADEAHREMAAWVLDARLVTVLCAVATIVVVFLTARRLYGLKGGLLAGALIALAPLHVLHSHYATVDVPLALFVSLCVYVSLPLVERVTWRSCLAAGACAGLAASVKYNGALVLVVPIVACLVGWMARRQPEGEGTEGPPQGLGPSLALPAGLVVLTGACAVAFFITSPYVLLAWPEAWRDISYEIGHMRVGEPPADLAYGNGWLFHLHAAVLLLPAAAMLLRGKQRAALMGPAVFCLLWFAMVGAAEVRYARYDIPLEPLAALGASGCLVGLAGHLRASWRVLSRALAIAACGTLLLLTCERNHVMTARDIRALALDAVMEVVPEGETLAIVWDPWFNIAPVDYCNGGTALRANPLFSRFQRPARRLEVTGLSTERLEETSPYAVLVSDFELDPALQSVSSPHRLFMEELQTGGRYAPALSLSAQLTRLRLGPGFDAPDNRYATPTIHLFVRRASP